MAPGKGPGRRIPERRRLRRIGIGATVALLVTAALLGGLGAIMPPERMQGMARPSPAMAAETARGARHGAGKAAAPLREVKAGGSECGEDFVVSLLQGGNVVMRLVADDHPRRDAEGRLHLAVKVHPDVSDVGLGVAPGTLAPGTIVDVYPSDDTTAIVVTVPDLECRSEATRGKSD